MESSTNDPTQQVGERLSEIRDSLSERTQQIRDTVTEYVDQQPLAAVGIAFGVGYLLSGALFSRTTFRAAHLGARFALGGALKQLLLGVGPGLLMGALGQQSDKGAKSRSRTRSPQH